MLIVALTLSFASLFNPPPVSPLEAIVARLGKDRARAGFGGGSPRQFEAITMPDGASATLIFPAGRADRAYILNTYFVGDDDRDERTFLACQSKRHRTATNEPAPPECPLISAPTAESGGLNEVRRRPLIECIIGSCPKPSLLAHSIDGHARNGYLMLRSWLQSKPPKLALWTQIFEDAWSNCGWLGRVRGNVVATGPSWRTESTIKLFFCTDLERMTERTSTTRKQKGTKSTEQSFSPSRKRN